MQEIRIHARAGQGAITTGVLLARAAFYEGKYVQTFPTFGAARMGAPMNAFIRIDDKEIRKRSQITEPDAILIIDPTLITHSTQIVGDSDSEGLIGGFSVFQGLKQDGIAIVNSEEQIETKETQAKVIAVPASKFAAEEIGKPEYSNTAMLGALVAATEVIKLESLKREMASMPAAEGNIVSARRAYEFMKERM